MKGELFKKYVLRIDDAEHHNPNKRLKAWYRLFTLILEELSDEHNISFTTLFSRIAYVGAKLKIDGKLLFLLHSLRRGVEQEQINPDNIHKYLELARFVCVEMINKTWQLGLEQSEHIARIYQTFHHQDKKSVGFVPVRMGLLVSWEMEKRTFSFIDDEDGVTEWTVAFDVSHKNEIFTGNLTSLYSQRKPPIHINLIDVEEHEGNMLVPKAFIIEPDYLIDVTAVANAFKYYGTEPLEQIVNKFRPPELSVHLLIGNIANFLLDELVNDPAQEYRDLVPKIFSTSPLLFTCLNDKTVNETMAIIKMHFDHLKIVVNREFKKEGISTSQVYLEPSYYSRIYGIQGRLDLLHEHKDHMQYDIVELKSGSPFRPNNYGLSVQHYTQTLLYDLIIKSVYRGKRKTSNYILYSKETEWNLRNAPVMKVQQYEAMKVRNELVLLEYMLGRVVSEGNRNILAQLSMPHMPKIKGFTKKNVEEFAGIYSRLEPTENSYFNHFTQFIAREHHLAKVGEHGLSKSNGLAALWLEDKEEKQDRFSILYGMEIIKNQTDADQPLLVLKKSEFSPALQKFRQGDIVVLYPDDGPQAVLNNQIFKCNIVEIHDDVVHLKLRSRQYNHKIFRDFRYWAIEGDVMDSSFLSMYKSLYTWAAADIETRQMLLGRTIPQKLEPGYVYHSEELTGEQNKLLNEMILARDYYLLWGPPGTGKTSIVIKHLIRYLFLYTTDRILVCAYTNRAVDELCEAILDAVDGETENFVRVGSSHSTAQEFVPYLLDHQLTNFSNRRDVLAFLNKKRIIVSTLSSIINRVELFLLYDFGTLIIDEASQILEPMLIGLLTKFKKWIMVGDHKQLPAVVVQNNSDTMVKDEELQRLGISNTAMSLFERLYHHCVTMGWQHAYGILSAQGRMHQDLMEFPNQQFYENKLTTLPGIDRLTASKIGDSASLPDKRLVYIPTTIDEDFSWKTNRHEAQACKYIIDCLVKDNPELLQSSASIGIITPYRAQIAMIARIIQGDYPLVTIDTVERYQGGARDIIIISLCTNRQDQLENLVAPSVEGIDRKLNVALTRARERIFILGNEDILISDTTYAALLSSCFKWKTEIGTKVSQYD